MRSEISCERKNVFFTEVIYFIRNVFRYRIKKVMVIIVGMEEYRIIKMEKRVVDPHS